MARERKERDKDGDSAETGKPLDALERLVSVSELLSLVRTGSQCCFAGMSIVGPQMLEAQGADGKYDITIQLKTEVCVCVQFLSPPEGLGQD